MFSLPSEISLFFPHQKWHQEELLNDVRCQMYYISDYCLLQNNIFKLGLIEKRHQHKFQMTNFQSR
jgi:hypothetical protein